MRCRSLQRGGNFRLTSRLLSVFLGNRMPSEFRIRQPKPASGISPGDGPVRFLRPDKLNRDWHDLCEKLNPEELEQIRYADKTLLQDFLTSTALRT